MYIIYKICIIYYILHIYYWFLYIYIYTGSAHLLISTQRFPLKSNSTCLTKGYSTKKGWFHGNTSDPCVTSYPL